MRTLTIPISFMYLVASITASETQNVPDSINISPLIIAGSPADLGEIPWQVSLINTSIEQHFCGGSILSEIWVLTAAHCVYNASASEVTVKAGLVTLSNPGPYEQISSVTKITLHADYNPEFGAYGTSDLALLKLSRSFSFNTYVNSISLPSPGYIASGNGQVSGWGAVVEGEPPSDLLNKVIVPIYDFDYCYIYLADDMNEKLICAGGKIIDACQGDSGGPLACADGKSVVCGIVSSGEGCASGQPGVYTNVAYFLTWIQEHMV